MRIDNLERVIVILQWRQQFSDLLHGCSFRSLFFLFCFLMEVKQQKPKLVDRCKRKSLVRVRFRSLVTDWRKRKHTFKWTDETQVLTLAEQNWNLSIFVLVLWQFKCTLHMLALRNSCTSVSLNAIIIKTRRIKHATEATHGKKCGGVRAPSHN